MILRPTARVILVDSDWRVLLMQFEDDSITDPNDPDTIQPSIFWVTPGGGLELSETYEDGARRELFEETGIRVEIGPMVFEREKPMLFGGEALLFRERYFLARVESIEVSLAGQTDVEKRGYRAHRWWSLEELDRTEEVVFPPGLVTIVRGALGGSD